MIKYVLRQNKMEGRPSYGKWYAYPVKEETVELDKLAEHMAAHNTPYSAGAIKGILTDMVSCVKELLLDGKNVKLPDLAIFSIGIRSKGAASEEDFTVAANVGALRLRARATGSLSTKDLSTTLKKAVAVEPKKKAAGQAEGKE